MENISDINIPDSVFEAAAKRLSKRSVSMKPDKKPKAINLWFDNTRFYVELNDGRVIGTPLSWFPTLQNASAEQLKNYVIDTGNDIHWPDLDEDLLVSALL